MGYLTPMLIRNDDLGSIECDPEMIKKISRACTYTSRVSISTNYWEPRKWFQFWKPKAIKTISGCCNAIESMGTAHANVPRLFVVMGNTMVELNQFDTQNLDKHYDFYQKCAKFAKTEAVAVLKYFKENGNGKENKK